jgi:hypothetical protein
VAAVEVDIIGVGVVMLRIMICMGGRWIVRSLLVSMIDLAFFQSAMVLFFYDGGRRDLHVERFKS